MEVSVFAESIKRLYFDEMLNKEKIMELHKNGKLTIEEINYILDNN